MGLIKAVLAAGSTTLADQWKELFLADSLDSETLMIRGRKQIGGKSSNKYGNDNIITNGSGILVADGQCAMIVDQGEIVELCSEAGYYTYDASTEPTIFCGNLEKGIFDTFETFKRRLTYGGDTGKDQRIYYFNIKELVDNKFGTPNPIMFRVVDNNLGLDLDVSIRCSGVYSFKIADPILFYKNVAGNVTTEYTIDLIKDQLKAEFMTALQPAMAKLSELGLRPNQIPAHVEELCDSLNSALDEKWNKLRGLEIVSIALNPVTIPEEDQELIKKAQHAAILRNPAMAAATKVAAEADAMRTAAGNAQGAATGFIGMGMAMNHGGTSAESLFAMAGQNGNQGTPNGANNQPQGNTWQCNCGTGNTGNFCTNCGEKKPEVTNGKFCVNCGKKLDNQSKFCPECGAAQVK